MKQRHWRELVEIIGVIGIVASVLLLAWEVKQSNHIAKAEAEIRITEMYNQVHLARATDVEFAKLVAKIQDPDSHLMTATDQSQIGGLGWHYINIYWVIQTAFDNGLLDQTGLDNYKADLAWAIEHYPALAEQWVVIVEEFEPIRNLEIFEPVVDLIAARQAEAAN